MVAKRSANPLIGWENLNLAKIHMVAKLGSLIDIAIMNLNLAKIHMVAKRLVIGIS